LELGGEKGGRINGQNKFLVKERSSFGKVFLPIPSVYSGVFRGLWFDTNSGVSPKSRGSPGILTYSAVSIHLKPYSSPRFVIFLELGVWCLVVGVWWLVFGVWCFKGCLLRAPRRLSRPAPPVCRDLAHTTFGLIYSSFIIVFEDFHANMRENHAAEGVSLLNSPVFHHSRFGICHAFQLPDNAMALGKK
jgi:hypothetical protein